MSLKLGLSDVFSHGQTGVKGWGGRPRKQNAVLTTSGQGDFRSTWLIATDTDLYQLPVCQVSPLQNFASFPTLPSLKVSSLCTTHSGGWRFCCPPLTAEYGCQLPGILPQSDLSLLHSLGSLTRLFKSVWTPLLRVHFQDAAGRGPVICASAKAREDRDC